MKRCILQPAGRLFLPSDKARILRCRASRTEDPPAAREALRELHIPRHLSPTSSSNPKDEDIQSSNLISSIKLFDSLEIYPCEPPVFRLGGAELNIRTASKIKHFQALHKKTGIPFEQMCFWDDEPRNRGWSRLWLELIGLNDMIVEVEKLGVTFVLVKEGLTTRNFEEGLREWARQRLNSV